MKSKKWLERQDKDYYVKKALEKGYLSRASFKLIEINQKFKFIEKSKYILELGSAPGGWSQIILETNPKVKLYAFDIINMKYLHNILVCIKHNEELLCFLLNNHKLY